jgi:hypothetical protein
MRLLPEENSKDCCDLARWQDPSHRRTGAGVCFIARSARHPGWGHVAKGAE